MKIIVDKEGNTKEVNSIRKISNTIHDVINNEDIFEDHVEFMVQGKNRVWPDWMDYNRFKELNPEIEV